MSRIQGGGLIGGALLVVATAAGDPAAAAGIEVVASIKPVHSLVAGVMEGVGEPVLLVKGASSPHGYQLRPSEARALDRAGVVFWIGEGLETFLAKPLVALSSDAVIVELSEAAGVALLPTRAGGMWEEHDHAESGEHAGDGEGGHEEHAEEPDDDGDAHEHGRFDMHLWLDPENAQAMVGAIVAALSEADPDHATAYASNGGRLHDRLAGLDAAVAGELAPVRERPFVVFHDAYHYFENRYDLNAVGAIAVDPGRRPGARRLGEIRDRLEQLDAACVFAEPQFEPALVDTVIAGTGARKGVLDPIGAALDAGPDQYFRLIDGLAASLRDCLGASKSG